MICESLAFQNRVVNIYGTVCRTALCLLILLTRLKQGWINSGIIKMLCMILKHSCKEPEVVTSVYMKNLSMYLNRKVIKWGGHIGLGLHSQTPSTSTSDTERFGVSSCLLMPWVASVNLVNSKRTTRQHRQSFTPWMCDVTGAPANGSLSLNRTTGLPVLYTRERQVRHVNKYKLRGLV